MFCRHYIGLLFLACSLVACTSSIREAQTIVTQADNLWLSGQMYSDSATLARAYETLDTWQWVKPDEYAHACYHYGKLLRTKDNPMEAMQAFINATHSRTHDYHILGRVYNNMGDICHLAGEYALSYDMFEQSSKMYWINGDTLLYYYCLNDMAFELAEQGKKDSVLLLVNEIEGSCSNEQILLKILETKAVVCKKIGQYDSVLFYTSCLLLRECYEPAIIQLRAQAYSFLGEKDSAVHYANYALSVSNNIFDVNGALYILTHDDEKKDIQAIRKISADRSDVQKCIEINQGKLSQAVQLLEQDINRKPNLTWLYAIIITCMLTGGMFYWRYRIRRRQMHTQIKQICEKQTDNIMHSIRQHIDKSDINQTLHWKDYSAMKTDADLYMGNIVSKLETEKLNETEIRFCILTMLKFSHSQIAETIHYGYPSGIKTLKKRISVKLGTTPPQLRDILLHMASVT